LVLFFKKERLSSQGLLSPHGPARVKTIEKHQDGASLIAGRRSLPGWTSRLATASKACIVVQRRFTYISATDH
jgi:hypothetical protein